MKKQSLLVITNNTQAKIFEITGGQYKLIHELNHSQSRLKSQQLASDKPGHYQIPHKSRWQYIPLSSPHEIEKDYIPLPEQKLNEVIEGIIHETL